ncbi:MAG: hypothetical protein V5A68_07095, partial [Candidatus Thermoplasmatota archaeon]
MENKSEKIKAILITVVLFFSATLTFAVIAQPNYTCLKPHSQNDNKNEIINDTTPPNLKKIIENYGLNIDVTQQKQYQIWSFKEEVNSIEVDFEYIGNEAGNDNVFGYIYEDKIETFNPVFQEEAHDGYPNVDTASSGDTKTMVIQRSNYEYLSFGILSDDESGPEVGENRSFYTLNRLNPNKNDSVLVYHNQQDLGLNEYLLCIEDRPKNVQQQSDYDDFIVLM